MNKVFEVLTRYSKLIFFIGLVLGFLSAYLGRIEFHPSMSYIKDFCMVLVALGLAFWPRT